MKMKKRLLSILLSLALMLGLMPGMSLTAYAAGGTEVTQANVICQQYSYVDAGSYSGGVIYDTPPADITNIALADAQAFGAAVNCPTTYWVVVYAKDGDNLKWTSNGKTGEQTSTPRSASERNSASPSLISFIPTVMTLREIPDIRLTSVTPPRPIAIASEAR